MVAHTTITSARTRWPINVLNKCGALVNGAPAKFRVQDFTEAAKQRCRLDDFGPGDFFEPLARLLESCARDAHLTVAGRFALRSDTVRLLCNRLLMQRDRLLDPAIQEQRITAPVFIVGLPRTGTTVLHTLLAADPIHRVPLTWEVMTPSPATSHRERQRIRDSARALDFLQWAAPAFGRLHAVGAELPQECVSLMSPSFLSDQFDTMYNVPTYRGWFLRQDLRPAYEFHRRFLQHLNARRPGKRWILKAPAHMFALPSLLSAYPDALFVQTHRAPLQAIASVSSLITILRRIFSDRVDPIKIGLEALHYWADTLNNFMEQRDSMAPGRILDLQYRDLKRDPIGAIRGIYNFFGWQFSAEFEKRMQSILTGQPRDQYDFHRYDAAQFGLRPEQEEEFFGAYCERFGVGSKSAHPVADARQAVESRLARNSAA